MTATMTELEQAAPGTVWAFFWYSSSITGMVAIREKCSPQRVRTIVMRRSARPEHGYKDVSLHSPAMVGILATTGVRELSGWTREKVLMLYEHDPEALWRAVVRELARRDEGC